MSNSYVGFSAPNVKKRFTYTGHTLQQSGHNSSRKWDARRLWHAVGRINLLTKFQGSFV